MNKCQLFQPHQAVFMGELSTTDGGRFKQVVGVAREAPDLQRFPAPDLELRLGLGAVEAHPARFQPALEPAAP